MWSCITKLPASRADVHTVNEMTMDIFICSNISNDNFSKVLKEHQNFELDRS